MLLFQLLATAAPPMSPELRTAIATEQLTTATRWLALVGVPTLIAAVAAFIVGLKAYLLEVAPAVSITGTDRPRGAEPQEQLHWLHVTTEAAGSATVTVEEWIRAKDIGSGTGPLRFYVCVRNIGRSPIVEAECKARVTVSEPIKITGTGTLRIASILPGETAYVPIAMSIGSSLCTIEVVNVYALAPRFGKGRNRRKKRVRFVAATTLLLPGVGL